MRRIYKTLSANDLGITGSHQAGMHVPKRQELLTFFPQLDEEAFNPRREMGVYCQDTHRYWRFNFIHYNNKVFGSGTRNEYRLTQMTAFFREGGYQPGDDLVFVREESGDITVARRVGKRRMEDAGTPTITLRGWSFVPEGEIDR